MDTSLNLRHGENVWKTLWPLAGTQFLGVFNDHAFKIVAIFAAVGASREYSANTAFLAILTIFYALPFILFPSPAGYLSDRFSKRNVIVIIKLVELAIMLCGTLCLAKFADWGTGPLIFVMFLLASQSTFFSPALNGILPETFSEKEISHVNGIKEMVTMLAVILGMSIGIIVKKLSGDELYRCGLFFSCLSIIAFVISLRILPRMAANSKTAWTWKWFGEYSKGFKIIKANRAIFLSILGNSFFVGIGTAIQLLLLVFAKYNLHLNNEIEQGIIQLTLALGIGVGCYAAGRMSCKKVELGLVPFGALGIVIFLALTVLCTGSPVNTQSLLESAHHALHMKNKCPVLPEFLSVSFYPWMTLHLILLGFSGGLFMVPLRAYIQNKTCPANRGTILANANVIVFSSIILAGILILVCCSGTGVQATGTTTSTLGMMQQYFFNMKPVSIFISLSFLTLVVSVYACWLLPEFMARFIVVVLTHTIYKIRISGEENIPEHGPALLVSNHVSFVDGLLITACSSRFVRFIMHSDYYEHPLFHPIVRLGGMIPIPSPNSQKGIAATIEKTHEALRNGEVVCIFPEGKLTRNGVMDEFRKGFQKMIPEGLDVPLIPVRLGMLWGSIFSYYYGKIKIRIPVELPHPATVTIGKPIHKDIEAFELRQVISELAAEAETVPRNEERPLHYQFAKFAKRHPFRKFLFDQSGKSASCFEILVKCALLSREIRKLSAPGNKYVGILMPNTIAGAVSAVATMMCDKVPAMLNYTLSKGALDEAVKKADLDCILTSRLFVEKLGIEKRPEMVFLEDLVPAFTRKKIIFWSVMAALLPRQELMNILAPRTHRNVFETAVLLFSSGSSGSPKGVLLSHHNINSDVYSFWRIIGLRKYEDSILGNLPLFHSFGFTTGLWIPFMTGIKVVYVPNPLDASATGKMIQAHDITVLLATPTFLQSYMRKCTAEQFKSLRLVVVGAEKMRKDIAVKFKEMTGLEAVEGYGCTELSPVVSINIANSMLDLGTVAGPEGSAGTPMPGICVKIVNPGTFQPLPHDTEGLMLVKGPNVMQGYLNDPEKTAEVIRDGWYNTGDIAKINPDGRIFITGRLSRFSKIGGEMVPHELVEATIQEIVGQEEKCVAVCGIPDEKKGERLAVLHTFSSPSPEEIIARLRTETDLPNLWIPKAESFIRIDRLPLLGSGKLDIKKIREILETKNG